VLFACAAAASGAALGLCARMERAWLPLLFIALVPWLAALDRARSLAGALGAALLFALAWSTCVFGWFAAAIVAYTGAPLGVAWLVLLALAPLLEPQLFVFALTRWRTRHAGRAFAALTGALAWVGAEWALPKLFADSLGHGLLPSAWLRQGADVAGVGGLTFAVVVVNECALALLRAAGLVRPRSELGTPALRADRRTAALRAARAPAGVATAAIAALALYGALRLRALEAELARAPRLTAGIVQADIARYGRLAREVGSFDAVAGILEAHFALSHRVLALAELDLLLWPETVYPTTFGAPKSEDGEGFDRALAAFVGRTGIPLVFGAYDTDAGREYNAAFLLEPDGDGRSRPDHDEGRARLDQGPERVRFATVRKAALFPFTERVPAWLDSEPLRKALPWLGSWSPGRSERVLPLALGGRSVRLAPLICYDALDPALARAALREGAELIVTLSNDAWFAEGAGPHLHLAMAAFRSLETRRAQLRATPTGVSAVVLPNGEIAAQLPVHARDVLAATVPLLSGPPGLFARFGDWLGPLAALGAAGLVLATRAGVPTPPASGAGSPPGRSRRPSRRGRDGPGTAPPSEAGGARQPN
jgi:apolipoprotein N-acyltransferase